MSWIQKLYETYENCQANVGIKNEDDKAPLLPVSHITQKMQIEINIDQDGNFKGANSISKEDALTIIPCSEESGGRSGSDPKCHPLCDKLQYIAKDFCEYVDDLPQYQEKQKEMHEAYLQLFIKWNESKFSHPKIKAILKYIQKGVVAKDLIESGVLKLERNGKLKPKIANAFIRWRVYIPNDLQEKTWCDNNLINCWIQFDASIQRNMAFCYVTGKEMRIAKNHPKYIRVPGDSAKIISSNDTSGFTYRGRFTNAEQACGIGYEVSQKAHNALRWLIGRQGKVFFEGKSKEPGLTIVAWATKGEKIVDPLADPFTLLGFNQTESDTEVVIFTAQELALKLKARITGYSTELGDTTDVVVMGLDSATPGRMSIIFYRELTGSDFLNRINCWHSSCNWYHNYWPKEIMDSKTGKKITINIPFVGAPAPSTIAEAAYGSKVDDKLRRSVIERILPCIIDSQKIPRDLVDSVVRRASNRMVMESWEWNKTLSIACALYKKHQIDYKKEDFSMSLEENRRTRDYLYGRLLALADSLEQWALTEARENRQTNAARLMQRFAEHPYTTWRTIELSLGPYKARLGPKSSERQKLIAEVTAMFDTNDYISDKKLNGEFLLGYHCQREALRHKAESDNN